MVKVKHRYILAEVIYPNAEKNDPITDQNIFTAVMKQVGLLHGDLGYAMAQSSFQVKVCDSIMSMVVMRVAADALDIIVSSIPFVLNIGLADAVLRVMFQGSSMRTVEKKLLAFNLKAFYAQLRRRPNSAEADAVRQAIARVTGSQVAHIRL